VHILQTDRCRGVLNEKVSDLASRKYKIEKIGETSGSYGGEYEGDCLLGCCVA
jgi:hypothetical protein